MGRGGAGAPNHEISASAPLVVDINATIVIAQREQVAAPTFKRTYGFHPLVAFVDHGEGGTGEPLAMPPGLASITAAAGDPR